MIIRTTALIALFTLGCGKSTPKPEAEVAAPTAPAAADVAAPAPDAAPAAPDAAPAAEVAAATPDCVPHDVMAVLGSIDPDFAKLDAGVVSLCGDAQETRHCVALDLASGKRTAIKLGEDDVAHMAAYPAGFDDGLIIDDGLMRSIQAKDGKPAGEQPPSTGAVLKVCPPEETRCKELYSGRVLAAHFSKDKARVVVTSLDEGKLNAHIYTTATQAEELVVPIGATDLPNCSFAAFAGDALVIATGACGGAGKAWIADGKTGTKIADIGKSETAFVRDGQFAHVDGNLFVFRDASGKAAYVQDVTTGDVKATIDIDKASDGTKAKHDAAFVFATATEVILVEARPLLDTVIVASPTDGSITKVHVPRPCP